MRASARGICVLAALFAAPAAAPAQEAMPSPEEMWEIIRQQQAVIEELRAQVRRNEEGIAAARESLAETDVKVEATGDLVESAMTDDGAGGGWWADTQLGGYGEVHYNGGDKDQVDVHRFVLFLGHDFADDLRFAGELEVEHALAGDGKPGEVEVEQAFVEWDFAANHAARAGVFLVPVGMLNETHEPPTFFGVERNNVEKDIIPTTWWEAGVGVAGAMGSGLSWDLSAHSGLKVKDDFKIRGGRQKVAEAAAKSAAFTGRLRWTGAPGVEIAATGQYQTDVTQEDEDIAPDGVSATLIEAHADIRRGMFGLRALAARWDLDGAEPAALGRDMQWGWFVEPSVRFDAGGREIGLFARYSMTDNEAGNDDDTAIEYYDVGTNLWLHEDVVLKLDVTMVKAPDGGKDDTILNAGVGFQF